ncbi:serine hydrolase domain-containing protein [Nitratireductor sp. XY-223]|uniref:serine hydrolase domain-containing protein n=1 Tax=Nitratireductor sp. XY-223 TaxID=2561926 RepID=UPI0010AB3BE4|nr:serine hydrolase domain-containing protein [Nitratireductor sp. XY-223]
MNVSRSLEGSTRIEGYCEPGFEPVLDRFTENFERRREVGASVCMHAGGRVVVDLWGGFQDQEQKQTWDRDTVSVVYSCTKAATALCAHILIDRGALDLDRTMSHYWPEFAAAGKEDATVRMALDHTAGVPALREPVKRGGFNDWDYVTGRLAAEPPFWKPGTKTGYHMFSFGWTVGELVRRVSGKSLGAFFRDEIADPLGLDFWIGLPADAKPAIAPVIPYRPEPDDVLTDFVTALITDRQSTSHLAYLNNGRHDANSPEAHAAEIGGAGGIANARALAAMYRPLAARGGANGPALLSRERTADMARPSAETDRDETLLIPTRFSQGFMLSMDNRDLPSGNSVVIGPGAFGHVGMGGSIGFADPDAGLAFGYTMNRLGGGILLNERGQGLVDAAYACIGQSSSP